MINGILLAGHDAAKRGGGDVHGFRRGDIDVMA